MEKVTTYYGFDIQLDVEDTKLFHAGKPLGWYGDEFTFKTESLSAMFKLIDEFVESNKAFEPFQMVSWESYNGAPELDYPVTILGINKGGNFYFKNENGYMVEILREGDYIDVDIRNNEIWNQMLVLYDKANALIDEAEALKANFHRKTLADKRKELGIVRERSDLD